MRTALRGSTWVLLAVTVVAAAGCMDGKMSTDPVFSAGAQSGGAGSMVATPVTRPTAH